MISFSSLQQSAFLILVMLLVSQINKILFGTMSMGLVQYLSSKVLVYSAPLKYT